MANEKKDKKKKRSRRDSDEKKQKERAATPLNTELGSSHNLEDKTERERKKEKKEKKKKRTRRDSEENKQKQRAATTPLTTGLESQRLEEKTERERKKEKKERKKKRTRRDNEENNQKQRAATTPLTTELGSSSQMHNEKTESQRSDQNEVGKSSKNRHDLNDDDNKKPNTYCVSGAKKRKEPSSSIDIDNDEENNKKQKKRSKKRRQQDNKNENPNNIRGCLPLNGLTLSVSTQDKESNHSSSYKTVVDECKSAGATVTPQVHKRVYAVVCNRSAVLSLTQRVRKALKHKIPIVDVSFVRESVKANKRLDLDKFLLTDLAVRAVDAKFRGETTNDEDDSGHSREIDPNFGWSEAVTLDCCCVCHENGDLDCIYCVSCNITIARKKKMASSECIPCLEPTTTTSQ